MSGLHRVLNMPECSWICLVEYARICVNMSKSKSVWTAFVLYFPIVIPWFPEWVVTCFNVYTTLEVLVCRKMRLFSWRQNLIFSIVVATVLFGFCFRLNTFPSNISNLLSPFGDRGGWGLRILIFLILVYFYL